MTDLKVEYKNIKELIPYCNNSRTHSDDQVLQIASSIKEFGFTNPVLIDGLPPSSPTRPFPNIFLYLNNTKTNSDEQFLQF